MTFSVMTDDVFWCMPAFVIDVFKRAGFVLTDDVFRYLLQETVDSAPVFCRSRETGEDVFIAFTVPLNEDCDGTVQYFWGVEVL